jgi:LPXTG-site transpeptidase (sortase) family protein
MADNDSQPTSKESEKQQQNAAADVIRGKLNSLYSGEPNAQEEIAEVATADTKRLSKHQKYMQQLSSDSERSLADIQTAWHDYYANLPDDEKHEVWQEFYDEHERQKLAAATKPKAAASPEPEEVASPKEATPKVIQPRPAVKPSNEPPPKSKPRRKPTTSRRPAGNRSVTAVKKDLLDKVAARTKIKENHHVKALLFGLSMGSLVLLILLFGFFNERFVTPFIRPSQHVSATPIIVDPSAMGSVGPESKIIIPKINIEAPVVYDEPSIEEGPVQKALERGVLHYATTPNPGEQGNAVIFGHSSGNILNKGKYKFAFILLKSLENDDTFIVQKDGKRYVYKVYKKFITSPTDLSVLNTTDRKSTLTLITCDPPGMSTNRLIIVGEQIYPDPGANPAAKTLSDPAQTPKVVPGNSPSLWQRIKGWF